MNLTTLTEVESKFLTGSTEQQRGPLNAVLDAVAQAKDFRGDAAYTFREFYISAHMLSALRAYIEHGVPTGGFLSSVICNDLSGAVGRADEVNLRNIPAYAAYMHNEAPSTCWGSREKMDLWLHRFERERREKMAEANEPFVGACETDT